MQFAPPHIPYVSLTVSYTGAEGAGELQPPTTVQLCDVMQ